MPATTIPHGFTPVERIVKADSGKLQDVVVLWPSFRAERGLTVVYRFVSMNWDFWCTARWFSSDFWFDCDLLGLLRGPRPFGFASCSLSPAPYLCMSFAASPLDWERMLYGLSKCSHLSVGGWAGSAWVCVSVPNSPMWEYPGKGFLAVRCAVDLHLHLHYRPFSYIYISFWTIRSTIRPSPLSAISFWTLRSTITSTISSQKPNCGVGILLEQQLACCKT